MTQTAQLETTQSEISRPAEGSRMMQYVRAFVGLFLRDLHVLRREIFPFVIRVCMNPLLFLFVFTFIMPHMSGGAAMNPTASMAGGNFSTVLLPGLMATAIMFSGIAAVALPLAQEFGITREIDDRVMCPLPVAAVAIEKVCFSAMQSVIAAAVVFPLAYYIPATPVVTHVNSWPYLIVVLVLASLTSGALGLTIGTSVKPQQIGLIFGVVVMPITFLGCVYYPWVALKYIRWLQIGVLINPIVYMSEGLRSALTPTLPHMPHILILSMLTFFLVVLTWLGIRGFLRRVIG
ncbi:ABC-2 type transport system permease protein [Edaphobacter aggregans]|jgi:ABC-2 type transport system permease protein|uniref:ABC-2 type transport system permease protein n=1 Tax=Edaphobacter aggregans TaxID=570835 RepID=A0A3R9Q974_9BACT|nr:ABC transporter permease [Edaphobacter aggregans]RSL16265.1 ABC-2 type transport system permease protein [Edaphobacter aggregans]